MLEEKKKSEKERKYLTNIYKVTQRQMTKTQLHMNDQPADWQQGQQISLKGDDVSILNLQLVSPEN